MAQRPLPAPPPPPAAGAALESQPAPGHRRASSGADERSPATPTRLRIDVPDNDRFIHSSAATKGTSLDAGKTASGRPGGRNIAPTYIEPGQSDGRGARDLEASGSLDSGTTEAQDPPRTPVALPQSSYGSAEIWSDNEEEGEGFHDTCGDLVAQGVASKQNGIGLGIAGPSTSLPRRSGTGTAHEVPHPPVELDGARTHASSEDEEPMPPPDRRGGSSLTSHTFATGSPTAPSHKTTATVADSRGQPLLVSHPSNSSDNSSEPSTVSVPSAPTVDLSLPNRSAGPYESVANGPMASLAAANAPALRAQASSSSARSFFSNLLNRSPRSSSSPHFGSRTVSSEFSPGPSIPRSPSTSQGWRHPSAASIQSNEPIHNRSTSMPLLPDGNTSVRDSRELHRPPSGGQDAPTRRTPRAIAAATFAGLTRSASLRGMSGSPHSTSGPFSSSGHPAAAPSPASTYGFATPPLPSASASNAAPPSLNSIGLGLVPLTQPLSLSRGGQPLCGAILDQRYLLIGTTTGLDFLPLPLPGSLPMQQVPGGKKRRSTRKPISLIRRTRFKELAVLSERSNILLAIAGRNDHVRVYALDGIRAIIEKKMQDVEAGYPIMGPAVSATTKLSKLNSGLKGKERVGTTSDSFTAPRLAAAHAAPYASRQLPASHSRAAHSEQTRGTPTTTRRPRSWHDTANPGSPVRISRQPSSASIVRAIPTNPTTARGSVTSQGTAAATTSPRMIRGQKSREFIAGRRNSTATISHRRSRADLDSPTESRRTSMHSTVSRRGSARHAAEQEGASGSGSVNGGMLRMSVPAVPRVPSDSAWRSDALTSPPPPVPAKRMEPRPPLKAHLNPHERSPTSDLADFLRDSGPDMRSPEMDQLLASSQGRYRSSVMDDVLQSSASARDFPRIGTSARSQFDRSQTASQLAGLALYTTTDGGEVLELLQEPGNGENRSMVTSLVENKSSSNAPSTPPLPSKRQARSPTTPGSAPGQRSPSMELAALLRATGPDDVADEVLDQGGSESAATAAAAAREAALSRLEARSTIEQGRGEEASVSTASGQLSASERPADGSPSSRASKRWTMSAIGSKFLNRPAPKSEECSPERRISSSPRQGASGSVGRPRSSPSMGVLPETLPTQQPAPQCPAIPTAPLYPLSRRGSGDRKRRPAVASLHPSVAPSIAPSSRLPPDPHPASSASPLEYVKLARTKGARMMRAVETKKRTYLAVLSGEDSERIELFTGSRSISLSLNRTFVLPETPHTMELQLQGDDLVDLFLVYPESIFALEPSTVRVREVGVGRGTRRARRERERRLRDFAAATADSLAAAGEVEEAPLPHAPSDLHPADPTRLEREQSGTPFSNSAEGEDMAIPLDSARCPPSPVPAPRPLPDSMPISSDAPPSYDVPPRSRSTSAANYARDPPLERNQAPPSAPVSRSRLPYSNFQQLPFVPPVPSSVLSSAWTIPPLYSDVVASPAVSNSSEEDPLAPPITVTGANGALGGVNHPTRVPPPPPPHAGSDIPLLSPVSLLGGAAIRHTGPPGLFFVSKGQSISGIVTADGKSIIKRPLIWSDDQGGLASDSESQQSLEVLVIGGTRTVVVKVSPTDVKAISVDGGSTPFSVAVPVTRSDARSQVSFLANHRAGQQLLFAQTIGSSATIMCLSPLRA